MLDEVYEVKLDGFDAMLYTKLENLNFVDGEVEGEEKCDEKKTPKIPEMVSNPSARCGPRVDVITKKIENNNEEKGEGGKKKKKKKKKGGKK